MNLPLFPGVPPKNPMSNPDTPPPDTPPPDTPPPDTPPPDTPPPDRVDNQIPGHQSLPHGVRDWTLDLPQTSHVQFFRETDWASSALGPLHTWDDTLRLFARMVLVDSRAACIWWYAQRTAPLDVG